MRGQIRPFGRWLSRSGGGKARKRIEPINPLDQTFASVISARSDRHEQISDGAMLAFVDQRSASENDRQQRYPVDDLPFTTPSHERSRFGLNQARNAKSTAGGGLPR